MPPIHQILVSRLVGGAAVIAIRLAAAGPRQGFGSVVWVPGEGPAATALDLEHVIRRKYDLEGARGPRLQQFAACARMLPGLLKHGRPIVHVHNPTVFGLLRPALLASGARTIVHFHSDPSAEEIAWTLKSPPACIITCARHVAEVVSAHASRLATPITVTAVPNAVDTDKFVPGDPAEARRRLGLSTSRFVVLLLANLAPNKGQATALKAVAELVRRALPVECWLVGEDRSEGREYDSELRRLSNDLQLDAHVRFLGFRRDVPDLLNAADAFVLPSTHEGLPLSVLEAQAAGVPVVGSNIPGILEIVVDGETGFVVPPDDAAGYADRLQLLFQERQLRRRIVDAALSQVHHHHRWSTFEERMFAIYRSMAA